MTSSSNITVSVHFEQDTVFAGEDIECIITFIHRIPIQRYDAPRANTEISSRLPPGTPPRRPQQRNRGSTLSSQAGATPRVAQNNPSSQLQARGNTKAVRGHGRSLSIASLRSDNGHSVDSKASNEVPNSGNRPTRGHARSHSLQTIQQRRKDVDEKDVGIGGRASNGQKSPTTGKPSIVLNEPKLPIRPGRQKPARSRSATQSSTVNAAKTPSNLQQEFKFPPDEQGGLPSPDSEQEEEQNSHTNGHTFSNRQAALPNRGNTPDSSSNPVARILSDPSLSGTPRSSIDLYSMSNHSDETLASEYPVQPPSRQSVRGGSFRVTSKLSDVVEHAGPETLMMGFAQVVGSFTLDGSLVNQGPFEEVKRKGVVGGQGAGGVVGLETKKRDSGLFGSFGWSNIGESIGGLLGGGEMSSIKEMRNKASTKAIPLLSTPQSILFVDLKLAPGQSSRFSYKFNLPKGLPPSHKGRAMKISYQIQIGLQRPGGGAGQQVKSVEVPFRVFSTVDLRGDILAHDLLSPFIFLRDLAQTRSLSEESEEQKPPDSDILSFLNYTQALLSRDNSQSGLLSPTSAISPTMTRSSSFAEPVTSKEAIDLAVMRSNQPKGKLSTRFNISRSSRPVATILLPRSVYRLGEIIHLVIDFLPPAPSEETSSKITSSANQQIPVHAVLATLESAEKVDPAIALRSPASIHRYTRKIHAQASENALFARRLYFPFAVPPTATPEFHTSGVDLEWRIRVEFVTPRLNVHHISTNAEVGEDDDEGEGEEEDGDVDVEAEQENWEDKEWPELLEEVYKDDRGRMLRGIETIQVETFEVAVPVRIYGAVIESKQESDAEHLAI